jgi:endonuclease YncB( thermonuclease family)
MKRPLRNSIEIILLSVALFPIFQTLCLAAEYTVLRVYDGDTIKARGHYVEIKVRLAGIDAPETSKGRRKSGQPYGQQAKKHLEGLILNKTVAITGYDLDVQNQLLGVVYLEGRNINMAMVRSGLAEVYRGKHPYGFDLEPYRNAEKEAKEAKRGMWRLGDKYISPRAWRSMHRRR